MYTPALNPYVLRQNDDWFFDVNEARFKKLLRQIIGVFLVFGLVIPFLPIFEVEREKKEEIPPRFAKVLMKQQQKAPPKPPAPQKKPKPEVEKPKETNKKPVKKVKKAEKPKVAKKKTVQERVAKVGLLALRGDLLLLREDPILQRISNPKRKLLTGGKTAAKTSRASVVKNLEKGSGGIDTSKLSRTTTQTSLAQRNLTKISTKIQTGGDETRKGDERVNVRSIEEIRLVIARAKGGLQTLYTRQLRKNPGLKGRVLFELTISPSGQVMTCRIIQSELKTPGLEKKFIIKLKSLDFGAKDVSTTVIEYPLDFFPS